MYVILDTETTGHDNAGLLQLAVFNPFGESFDVHVKPNKPILSAATAVHGITNQEAESFMDPLEAQQRFITYVNTVLPPNCLIIGHNIEFDMGVLKLNWDLTYTRTLDTLRMCKKLYKAEEAGNHKLDTMFVHMFPHRVKELLASRAAHDALQDCKLTNDVFLALCAKQGLPLTSEADVAAVEAFVTAPIMVEAWPFGKHKGRPLSCDWDYVQWYMRQPNVDKDIAYTIGQLKQNRSMR